MTVLEELKKIKKLYGEDFMHLCRKLFSTILEQEGLLIEILQTTFATNSRTLGKDINLVLEDDFKNYIYNKVETKKEKIVETDKTPKDLLEEAGYDLYECISEEEIQSFKKYYDSKEMLCTFNGGRLNRCIVFWAVKKNVAQIKRENFDNPERDDEYGTSVMSIQFSRSKFSIVSIKNRYNHTVFNPDATYGNDLDRIIPGLKNSFAKLLAQRGITLDNSNIEEFEIPGYTIAKDGKFYKYNMEINGIYYCPGNIIIDHGDIIRLEAEKEILIDYFLLDKENKRFTLYDCSLMSDSFLSGFKNIAKIKEQKDKRKKTKKIVILLENCDVPITIEIDRNNNIIGYRNENLIEVGDNFLRFNQSLENLDTPNLRKIGDNFLFENFNVTKLFLPNLIEVGNCFFQRNQSIIQIELLSLIKAGSYFLFDNQSLKHLNLPKLENAGENFLFSNESLSNLELPNLIVAGNYFLYMNQCLKKINTPNLRIIGDAFLYRNQNLMQIYFPNALQIGEYFLFSNQDLEQVKMPKLRKAGSSFLERNQRLRQIELPELEKIGNFFLRTNQCLITLKMPHLLEAGDFFLTKNQCLSQIELPMLRKVGTYFLSCNRNHETISDLLEEIEKNAQSNYINSDEIARLDKKSKLSEADINAFQELFRNNSENRQKE